MTNYQTENSSEREINVLVYVSSFSYQLFIEQLSLETSEYLSQFGGALGLWLGTCFAAVIHIPIFFLRKGIEKILVHKRKNDARHDDQALAHRRELRYFGDHALDSIVHRPVHTSPANWVLY